MQNVFDAKQAQEYISRINSLTPTSLPLWGKMTVDQMLAHCNCAYESVYDSHSTKKTNWFLKWILKTFVKQMVINEQPYSHNLMTVPRFKIQERKNFEYEKKRLIGHIQKTQTLGKLAFNGKPHFSFGALSSTEWNNLFAKHLNHHLQQFGV